MRSVSIHLYGHRIGQLVQDTEGYLFTYDQHYQGPPLSISFPTNKRRFRSKTLHPYFVSLAPEGWLLKRYSQIQQIDDKDPFGILIQNGKNLIGAVQLIVENE